MALAASVVQVNVCLDSWLAMKAGDWGPSVLGYADRLIYFPLAIFGTAFATALLPSLSSSAANGDFESFAGDFQRSVATMCAIMLPSAIGLVALADPLISLIYKMGAFDSVATVRTAHALSAYAIGLVAAGATKIAPQAFYAMKDSKTPVTVGVACVALNLCLNLFFIWVLPPEWKPIGIAFATSVSSFVHCIALLCILSRRANGGVRIFRWLPLARPLAASVAASAAMGAVAWFGFRWLSALMPAWLHAKLSCAIAIAATIALAAASYAAILGLLCPSLLRDALSSLRHRRRRK